MNTKFLPDWISVPGDTIMDILMERNISFVEFSKLMEMSYLDVNNLIIGKTKINRKIADKLSKVLGASSKFWLNREKHYRDGWLNRLLK